MAASRRRRVRSGLTRVTVRVLVVMTRVDPKAAVRREFTEGYDLQVYKGKNWKANAKHEARVSAQRLHPRATVERIYVKGGSK